MNCTDTPNKDVDGFISRFHEQPSTSDTFLFGCCYWFADMLCRRFPNKDPAVMYDEVANHFGARLNGRVFDISGDVTDQYDWQVWDQLPDLALRSRIIRDCINF